MTGDLGTWSGVHLTSITPALILTASNSWRELFRRPRGPNCAASRDDGRRDPGGRRTVPAKTRPARQRRAAQSSRLVRPPRGDQGPAPTCSDAPRGMTLARVDNGHRARVDDAAQRRRACYLLSKEKVAGSIALARVRRPLGRGGRHARPDRNLPEYPGWGFLAADCWGYARAAAAVPPGRPPPPRRPDHAAPRRRRCDGVVASDQGRSPRRPPRRGSTAGASRSSSTTCPTSSPSDACGATPSRPRSPASATTDMTNSGASSRLACGGRRRRLLRALLRAPGAPPR